MIKYDGDARLVRQRECMSAATQASSLAKHEPSVQLDTAWRDTAFTPLKKAAHVIGCSQPSLYRLEKAGEVEFRRLAGRTLVVTSSLAALIDSAAPYEPSEKGAAARAKRTEIAKAAWQECAI